MPSQRLKNIVEFFDVSIVIPVPQATGEHMRTLMQNEPWFRQNGIEVILVTGGNTSEVLSIPGKLPFINWKIVAVPALTEPAISPLFNCGIQHALHKYVLVMTADMVLLPHLIYDLRLVLHYHPGSFSVIPAIYPPACPANETDIKQILREEDHLALMAERKAIIEAGGFGPFNDIRQNNVNLQRRLNLAGLKKMVVPAEIAAAGNTEIPDGNFIEILYPASIHPMPAIPEDNTVLFDWTREKSPAAMNHVLDKFERYSFKSPNIFDRKYQIICLMQMHNESANIPEVLEHLDAYCDGIILLDDASTDGSFEMADSRKLLLKVQKAPAGIFNDLENRNLLLQLGYLFLTDWFFFMDADERLDPRYAALDKIVQRKDIDVATFRLVHLWNDKRQYRKDLPEGANGVLRRYRMFRSKGFMQITSRRELHFPATPFQRNKYHSPVLLLHYGLMHELARKRKAEVYLQQDANGRKQGYNYDYLLDKNPELGNLDELNFYL